MLTVCFSLVQEISIELRVGEDAIEELIRSKMKHLVQVNMLLLVLMSTTRYDAYKNVKRVSLYSVTHINLQQASI